MSREALLYFVHGDMDPLIFETQVMGLLDHLHADCEVPVQAVIFDELGHTSSLDLSTAVRFSIERIEVPVHWWRSEEQLRTVAEKLATIGPGSCMCDDPRLLPLCLHLRSDSRPFFYNALSCRYKALEELKDSDNQHVEEIKALEMTAFKQADWVYAATEDLILHFKDHAAYRDHNHSIMPLAGLGADQEEEQALPGTCADKDATVFCAVGRIDLSTAPRSFLEACAEILRHPSYRLLIISEDIDPLRAMPFLAHPNCSMLELPIQKAGSFMAKSDYGIILSKPKASLLYAGSIAWTSFLDVGCKVLVSPGLGRISREVAEKELGLVYAGRKENSKLAGLSKVSDTERARIQEQAYLKHDKKAMLNQIKFRNLMRLHNGV